MWYMIRNIGAIIGDHVPEGDEHWLLVLTLLQFLDIVFAPVITLQDTILLKHKIKSHHQLFLILFPDRGLSPKMHFMTHYPRLMREVGPLIHHWSMRFEAKHQMFKQIAHGTRCFKNISKTFAKRHQMILAYHLQAGNLQPNSHGKINVLGKLTYDQITSVENKYSVSFMLEATGDRAEVTCVNHIEWRGVSYRKGMVVLLSCANGDPLFGRISDILVLDDVDYLVCQNFKVYGFSEHVHGFVIDEVETFTLVKVKELADFHPMNTVLCSQAAPHKLIIMRHQLCLCI